MLTFESVLHEPFQRGEEELLRWYVEDYARLEPFDIGKADAAKTSVARYIKTLIKGTKLEHVIVSWSD